MFVATFQHTENNFSSAINVPKFQLLKNISLIYSRTNRRPSAYHRLKSAVLVYSSQEEEKQSALKESSVCRVSTTGPSFNPASL